MIKEDLVLGNVIISFHSPRVYFHSDTDKTDISKLTMDDVMHFYYELKISNADEVVFEASSNLAPSLEDLKEFINDILNRDMSKAYVLSHSFDEELGFEHKVLFEKTTMNYSFPSPDYYFSVEKEKGFRFQEGFDDINWSHYKLIFSLNEGYCFDDNTLKLYSYLQKGIILEDLTEFDLKNLLVTLDKFIAKGISEGEIDI